MSKPLPILFERLPLPPELKGTAIASCCEAWDRKFKAAMAQGRGELSCRMRSNEAYRVAMPPLTSVENIRNFLSCVTYGMLVGTILPDTGTKLFYGAQVATAAFKSQSLGSQPSHRSRVIAADSSPGDPGMPALDKYAPTPTPPPVSGVGNIAVTNAESIVCVDKQ